MPKRASADAPPGPGKVSRSVSGQAREKAPEDEMGEFEDPWEDEVEDEDGVEGDGAFDPLRICMFIDDRRTVMEVDDEMVPPIEESEEKPRAPNVFIPGRHILGKDEVLEPDDSVYIMRHTMNTDWPCLSFDVLRDDEGDQRQRFPARACIVAGTQADTAKNNKLTVFKMTQLHKTQKDGGTLQPSVFFFPFPRSLVGSYAYIARER
jgi:ribosome assembly protein RRB1